MCIQTAFEKWAQRVQRSFSIANIFFFIYFCWVIWTGRRSTSNPFFLFISLFHSLPLKPFFSLDSASFHFGRKFSVSFVLNYGMPVRFYALQVGFVISNHFLFFLWIRSEDRLMHLRRRQENVFLDVHFLGKAFSPLYKSRCHLLVYFIYHAFVFACVGVAVAVILFASSLLLHIYLFIWFGYC